MASGVPFTSVWHADALGLMSWADGTLTVPLREAEQTKLCALVVIGVNERGEKRLSGDAEDECAGIDTEYGDEVRLLDS